MRWFAPAENKPLLLLDRKGAFFGTIAYGEASETAIAKLKRLVTEG